MKKNSYKVWISNATTSKEVEIPLKHEGNFVYTESLRFLESKPIENETEFECKQCDEIMEDIKVEINPRTSS